MSTQLVIETDKERGICTVRIAGTLRSGADDVYLQAKAQEIKATCCPKVLLDIRGLHSTGSSGMGFFVDLYTSGARNGGRLVLVAPTKLVREVLELTRLATIIPIAPDMEAGIAFLNADK